MRHRSLSPIDVYASALAGAGGTPAPSLRAVDERGTGHAVPLSRWLAPPTPAEEDLLRPRRGPVLDVGCGPGRHLLWLQSRGVGALGVELSPAVAALARRRGARVLEGSIFGRVPASGRWATALLLDGNVGIGGEPGRLLGRLGELLRGDGEIVAEVDADEPAGGAFQLRLAYGGLLSGPFPWARVGLAALRLHARRAGFSIIETWGAEGRRFARLGRHAHEALLRRRAALSWQSVEVLYEDLTVSQT
jgi:SAM-dependent methyltransferase